MITAPLVPLLEGERVRLRGHSLDDFADLCALWSDPSLVKYITGKPQTQEESWARLLRYSGHWQLLGYGYWLVEEKASGRYLGNVGFADYRRQIDPPFHGTPEAGWTIATWAQGKGYASEAVRLMHDWADKNFAGPRTVCFLDEENLPSLKLAQRLGYKKAYEATYKGEAVSVFERLRAD